ncbi:MAG: hypothetical protein ACYDGS_08745 [Thermoleophilia bacterium]
MNRKEYNSPSIEIVPLIAEEAVLSNCKVGSVVAVGPPQGWCSGVVMLSCSAVGS